jgi:hypothetical protein
MSCEVEREESRGGEMFEVDEDDCLHSGARRMKASLAGARGLVDSSIGCRVETRGVR